MNRFLSGTAGRPHILYYQHPLVGKPAPDFAGTDVDGKPWELKEALKKGPVVVVFYLGYYCNHCVSQLFDANEDYKYFRELGAEVVAVDMNFPFRPRIETATLPGHCQHLPLFYDLVTASTE